MQKAIIEQGEKNMSLRKDILNVFETHRGMALSGQQIADMLDVSRNSVWKVVKALQKDGYKIVAAPNRGYMLEKTNDILSPESIKAYLGEKHANKDIVVLASTNSTNAEAMKMLQDGKITHGALIVADEQTQGRGRMGKTFFSPKRGLYMSVCLCKNIENLADVMIITPAAAVAVRRAIAKYTDKDARIKWVNDVYIDGRKACGILTQADIDFESGKAGTFIVGIGVNFVNQDFPDEIKDRACALFEDEPCVTRSEMIAEIYSQLIALTDNLADHSFMEEYKRYSLVLGKEITYAINNEPKRGIVEDIDSNGGLIVREGGGRRILTCGEISIKSADGSWI